MLVFAKAPASMRFILSKDLDRVERLRPPHGFQLLHGPTLIELRDAILATQPFFPFLDLSALIMPKMDGSHITQFTNWSASIKTMSSGAVPAVIFRPVRFM